MCLQFKPIWHRKLPLPCRRSYRLTKKRASIVGQQKTRTRIYFLSKRNGTRSGQRWAAAIPGRQRSFMNKRSSSTKTLLLLLPVFQWSRVGYITATIQYLPTGKKRGLPLTRPCDYNRTFRRGISRLV